MLALLNLPNIRQKLIVRENDRCVTHSRFFEHRDVLSTPLARIKQVALRADKRLPGETVHHGIYRGGLVALNLELQLH